MTKAVSATTKKDTDAAGGKQPAGGAPSPTPTVEVGMTQRGTDDPAIAQSNKTPEEQEAERVAAAEHARAVEAGEIEEDDAPAKMLGVSDVARVVVAANQALGQGMGEGEYLAGYDALGATDKAMFNDRVQNGRKDDDAKPSNTEKARRKLEDAIVKALKPFMDEELDGQRA